jgi:hypothetical protein
MGAGQVPLTAHARVRMQQRGIRAAALEALLEHGRVRRAPGGADLVILDSKYAIVGPNGAVLTVGHRTRRLPRD